ncbi:unnamed protein product [Gongylonema pulchrum]|uniref:Ovule protein n=1 Tax=Gongylonema pulchrum TaxID=637853 RepID=A0A183DMP8_9BILA|nr:unnamed protein product [Gongylonema pulchrum]
MSFLSKDTFDHTVSKSREKERPSTISYTRSPEGFSVEKGRKRRPINKEQGAVEQQTDVDNNKQHLFEEEHEVGRNSVLSQNCDS